MPEASLSVDDQRQASQLPGLPLNIRLLREAAAGRFLGEHPIDVVGLSCSTMLHVLQELCECRSWYGAYTDLQDALAVTQTGDDTRFVEGLH